MFFLFSGIGKSLFAQVSISPQVISSTGNYSSASGISISATVGEVVVPTFFSSTHTLTQGFQQPTSGGLTVLTNSVNTACIDANNGYAEAVVKTGIEPYHFLWEPNGETTASIKNLAAGKYYVTVTDARGFSIRDSISIFLDYDGPCSLHIYSGLTPNNDNHNDTWVIDGITEFPTNNVFIFNRWGDKVWERENYNNTDVVWDGSNMQNQKLPQGTYFYIVTVDTKKYKGWVELTR